MDISEELRFSMSAEQYFERNHVMVYLEDALMQLLEHKDDNTNKVNPFKFFSSYFASVKEGTHVLLREYSFIKATLHNRASFVRLFWRSFANIARKTELMSIHDYHSLLCLLCPDFPMSLVQKTARIVLVDDSLDCLMSFVDFVYAFQLQLCFDEFLSKCAEVYQVMQQNRSSGLETVVVPTSQQRTHASASVAHGDGANVTAAVSGSDGVDSSLFQRTLMVINEKMDLALPGDIIKSALSSSSRVTFYSFLTTLAKSSAVNQYIGKLPPRPELMSSFEPEMTSTTPTFHQLQQPTEAETSSSSSAVRPPVNVNDNSNRPKSVCKATTRTRSKSRSRRNKSSRSEKRVSSDSSSVGSDDEHTYDDDFEDDDT